MNEFLTDDARPARRPTLSRIVTPTQIEPSQRARMYELLSHHYENVSPTKFEADLDDKDSVVLIEDDLQRIQGFTTSRVLWSVDENPPVAAVYSGDTLLSPDYMGERAWLSTWAKHTFGLARQLSSEHVYWVFAASSHRAYQFLPGFFREYYPHPDRPTPVPIRRILQQFIAQKFPEGYDPVRGIISGPACTPYRNPELVARTWTRDDRVAQFFASQNPDFLSGNLLACITEVSPDNVTAVGKRVLGSAIRSADAS